MVSEIGDGGNNEIPTCSELTRELEKLREYNCERETKIKILTNDSRKTKERLKALERFVGDKDHKQAINEQLVRTFIELSSECIVINKKLKYLRRLMKLNAQKLEELENITKAVNGKEDKFCQTEGGGDDEEVTSTCPSHQSKSDSSLSDADTLMSEMFYLPAHPEIPDLKLFSLL